MYFSNDLTVSQGGILTSWYAMHAITSVRGVRVEVTFMDRTDGSHIDRDHEAVERAEGWVLAEIAVNEVLTGSCKELVRGDRRFSPTYLATGEAKLVSP